MSAAAIALVSAGILVLLACSALAVTVAARRGQGSLTLLGVLSAPAFLVWALITVIAWVMTARFGVEPSLRTGCLAVGAVGLVGWVALVAVGWRRRPGTPWLRGRSWSISLLLALFVVAIGVGVSALVVLDNSRLAEVARRREANMARRSALEVPPPDAPRADATYNEAYGLVGDGLQRLERIRDDLPAEGYERLAMAGPFNDADRATFEPLVAELDPALQVLARVVDFPSADFGFDPRDADVGYLLPELGRLRGLARLSATAAKVAAARGDREAALRHILVLDRMAAHLVEQPTFVHFLVALAIRSLATDVVASIAGQVDLSDPRLVDPAFDDALAARLRAAIVFEHCAAESVLLDAAETGNVVSLDGRPDLAPLPPPLRAAMRLVVVPTEFAALDRGFARAEASAAGGESPATDDEQFTGFLAGILLPAADKVVSASRIAAISAELRRAAIAIRSSPDGAVADSALPRDPHATDGARLRLLRDGQRLTLYSVGPNRSDDGGPGTPGSDDVPLLRMRDVGE